MVDPFGLSSAFTAIGVVDHPCDRKPPKRHFTRKHYLAMQDIIRAHVAAAPFEDQDAIKRLVEALCVMLASEYPDFHAERFLRLCGLID